MDMVKVDMKEFEKEYNKQYDFIYNSNKEGLVVAGEQEALNYFNNGITEEEQYLLQRFSRYRMDILSSDREIIAFMFAFDRIVWYNGINSITE